MTADNWCLYLIRFDTRLYAGITNDMDRRLGQHRSGRGAKCLRGRTDLRLAYVSAPAYTHRQAARAEYRLKRKTKRFKEWVVAAQPTAVVEVLLNELDLKK
ncbi:ac79-like protein [Peridroma alphabaculovirus]|uniref:Ac79-like protein n=1 Tax=Peridroma alphabaculovirus TaxID=1346829 RepID=A0A068LKN9_9ABAC|nr:ac79-like protein [Peridroma alphabaculovirus]AIE47869.1 ac79-like protein [Peridroma alphabaculovirus]